MSIESNKLSNLDEEEKKLLKLMAEGLRTSEISKMLSLSYHDTAESCKKIKQKLNAVSISELKIIAEQTGLES